MLNLIASLVFIIQDNLNYLEITYITLKNNLISILLYKI